jgi:hypothetical protein
MRVVAWWASRGALYAQAISTAFSTGGGLTRFSGHSRVVLPSCDNRQVVVELLKAGGADHAETGMPAASITPTFNPLKHRGGELDLAGPGLPVEQF